MSNASEVFIGRQPIFDRRQRLVAYEILFRGDDLTSAQVRDRASATATVVLNALTEIGLERLVGSRLAWINLSRASALSGIATMLPVSVTGFEILEGEVVDDALVEAVRGLKQQGYPISLDDFEYSPELEPLLPLADIVKLDYQALGPEGFRAQMELLGRYPAAVLAEKVETREAHAYCMSLGCDLFQGFFYHRPELLSGRRIALSDQSVLPLIAALQDRNLQLEDFVPLIARDLPLSLRLLRYINSAFFGLSQTVTSVHHAIVLLGLENVRRWATLTVMGSLEGKSPELTASALIRARFCELAGMAAQIDGPDLFTAGMFSLVDAMLDAPMWEVLAELPFPETMRLVLLNHEGPVRRVLDAAVALEAGRFDDAELLVGGADSLYLQSLVWAQEAAGALSECVAA